MALGEAGAVGAEDERDMGPGRAIEPEQIAEQCLPGGRRQQVVSADDLLHSLFCVVDDDGEVVGDDAVAAAQDDVVGGLGAGAVEAVVVRDLGEVGAEAEGELFTGGGPAIGFGGRQLAAGSRVEALGRIAVLGRRRLADLAPGAEAAVDEPVRFETGEGGLMAVGPLRLDDGLAVPVEAERSQVGELRLGEALGRTRSGSRSSIRIRKREPLERANSQASSAVLRLPRWRSPVGEGA